MLDGSCGRILKPREQRRTVVLQARLRGDRGWGDACILNLSSRGLLVYSASAAPPGSVVEIRRGEQAIVARVVWRQQNRFGLQAQGEVQIEQLITGSASAATDAAAAGPVGDRRKRPRDAEDSRIRGRICEFAAVAGVGAVLAAAAYSMVVQSLSAPIAEVAEQLDRS